MDEFAQLNIDRLNEKELKTEEQIKRHTVDANIEKKPIERALYLLGNGEEIQRIAVIENLPIILKSGDYEHGVVTRVIPKLVASLQHGSSELQIVSSQVYSEIVKKKMINVRNIVQVTQMWLAISGTEISLKVYIVLTNLLFHFIFHLSVLMFC